VNGKCKKVKKVKGKRVSFKRPPFTG